MAGISDSEVVSLSIDSVVDLAERTDSPTDSDAFSISVSARRPPLVTGACVSQGELAIKGRELQYTKAWTLPFSANEMLFAKLRLKAGLDLINFRTFVRIGFRTEQVMLKGGGGVFDVELPYSTQAFDRKKETFTDWWKLFEQIFSQSCHWAHLNCSILAHGPVFTPTSCSYAFTRLRQKAAV